MFSLSEELPTEVTVDGVDYSIDMSFDNVLKMYEMLNDNKLKDSAKVILGIQMLFNDIPDLSLEELRDVWEDAFRQLFYEEIEKPELDLKGNPMPTKKGKQKKYMDLQQDAKYIYASFMQDYGIDLFEQQGKLHYYKFKALLESISENTKMKKVIEIRQAELPGSKNQKARKQMIEAKKHFALKEGD